MRPIGRGAAWDRGPLDSRPCQRVSRDRACCIESDSEPGPFRAGSVAARRRSHWKLGPV